MNGIGTSIFIWYHYQVNRSVQYILVWQLRVLQLREGSERVCNVSRSIRP